MKKVSFIIAGGFIVFAIVLFFVSLSGESKPGRLDSFAQCIKDKGAIFYGAFWCSHCQSQKALFGSSAKYLPYVECSTPDGQGQTQLCKDKRIEGYPTWEFPNEATVSAELTLEQLSQKTSCPLPK